MSKGSTPRPLPVSQDTFAERWERTFVAGYDEEDEGEEWGDDPLACEFCGTVDSPTTPVFHVPHLGLVCGRCEKQRS